jgi:hypothetical protein
VTKILKPYAACLRKRGLLLLAMCLVAFGTFYLSFPSTTDAGVGCLCACGCGLTAPCAAACTGTGCATCVCWTGWIVNPVPPPAKLWICWCW